jgi:hypothetical protein
MGGGSPAEAAAMDAARRHIAAMETALRGANGAATGANGAAGGPSPGGPSTNARGAPVVRSSFNLTFASGGAQSRVGDAAGRESSVPAGSSAASSAVPAGGEGGSARGSGLAGPEGAAEHIRLADLD